MPREPHKYMITTRYGTPLAVGYDEDGDPRGYIHATLDEAKAVLLKEPKGDGYDPARVFRIYELTQVYGNEE